MQQIKNGQAGVLRVAAELLMRGIEVYFPSVDTGTDLMNGSGIRIQVKSASLRHHKRVYPEGAYWFKLWQAPIVSGHENVRQRGWKDYAKIVDFVVFHGVDQNRFWIVPVADLEGAQCLVLGPASKYHCDSKAAIVRKLEGRWDLIIGCNETMSEVENVVVEEAVPRAGD